MVNAPFADTPMRLTYGGRLKANGILPAGLWPDNRGAPAAGSKRIARRLKRAGAGHVDIVDHVDHGFLLGD